jgi:flagellar assembly factor FliW
MTTKEVAAPLICSTRYFGRVEYQQNSVLVFPAGIPAFEEEKSFLAIRQPLNEPLVFLQSLSNRNLCFVTLPVGSACPNFQLSIPAEDLDALDLATDRQPVMGREVLCLTIISLEENEPPTANLLAPIVVNLKTQRGRQVIQTESPYSHRAKLPLRGAACS